MLALLLGFGCQEFLTFALLSLLLPLAEIIPCVLLNASLVFSGALLAPAT